MSDFIVFWLRNNAMPPVEATAVERVRDYFKGRAKMKQRKRERKAAR